MNWKMQIKIVKKDIISDIEINLNSIKIWILDLIKAPIFNITFEQKYQNLKVLTYEISHYDEVLMTLRIKNE